MHQITDAEKEFLDLAKAYFSRYGLINGRVVNYKSETKELEEKFKDLVFICVELNKCA